MASVTRTDRPTPFARIIAFTVAGGRWWPSTMKVATTASAASSSQMVFGWRGSICAHPLPRCVASVAPAATAAAICSGVAAVCPRRRGRPTRRGVRRAAIAPSTSGASVTSTIRPSAASWRRLKSSMLAGSRAPGDARRARHPRATGRVPPCGSRRWRRSGARARTRAEAAKSSNDEVMSVGRQRVTPVRRIALHALPRRDRP